MPPTLAAARNTASGRYEVIHFKACAWFVRSSSLLSGDRISQPSEARRRTSAEPTMPWWPATQTRFPAREKLTSVAIATPFFGHGDKILADHLRAELAPRRFVLPAQVAFGFRGVSHEEVDFRGAKIARIDLHQGPAGLGV